jgi:CHRD domain
MSRWSLAAALSLCLLSHAAWAEMVHFRATLNGASEVPPKTTQGKGEADATLDTNTHVLTYTITYSDLSGPATMAHFHGPADPGANAGVVVPFNPPTSPIKGSATLTEAQQKELLDGKWYANVHTDANKAGEIRGQMVPAK